VRQIERRWALQEAAKYSGSRLLRTADAYESAVGFVDASKTDDWRLLHLNTPAVEMLGALQDTCSCSSRLLDGGEKQKPDMLPDRLDLTCWLGDMYDWDKQDMRVVWHLLLLLYGY
jgi:hypothetical protein